MAFTEAQERVLEGQVTEPQYLVYVELDQPYYFSTQSRVDALGQIWEPGGVEIDSLSPSKVKLKIENDDFKHTQNAVSGVYQRGAVEVYWAYPGSGFENLLTWSEQFDHADWSLENATITADQAIAPDGSLTADLLSTSSTSGFRSVRRLGLPTTNDALTVSCYVKHVSGSTVVRQRFENSTLDIIDGTFDLSAETATVSDTSSGSASIESVGDGWYRISTTSLFGFDGEQIKVAWLDYDTPSTDDALYVWGAQLEQGDTLTAYKKTESATYNDPKLEFQGIIYNCPDVDFWLTVDARRTPPKMYPFKRIEPPYANHAPAEGYMITFDGQKLAIEGSRNG